MDKGLAKALLDWYDAHKRTMPWRDIANPYATWVSETMLQQTRVETVLRYYPRFMERFPTVRALAEADEADVLKMWEGLGYYRRASNLQRGARQVMAEYGGVIPRDVETLKRIHGIGDYTAGAIASIAFGERAAAVDGNVIRVVSRVRGIRENVGVPSVRRRLAAETLELVPADRPGDFNQALMDLGATVCVPGTPSCHQCPLCTLCDAFAQDDAEELPQLPRKNPPKTLFYDVCLVRSGARMLMRQRAETMLQGLWVFPLLEGKRSAAQLPDAVRRQTGLPTGPASFVGEARHVFTHQIWQMRLYLLDTEKPEAAAGWRFVTSEEMDDIAIPTAMRAAVQAAKEALDASH